MLYDELKFQAECFYTMGRFGAFARVVRELWVGWPVLRPATWGWAAPKLF